MRWYKKFSFTAILDGKYCMRHSSGDINSVFIHKFALLCWRILRTDYTQYRANNTNLVADHLRAGSLEFCLINDQVGVGQFGLFKELFMQVFIDARTSYSTPPQFGSIDWTSRPQMEGSKYWKSTSNKFMWKLNDLIQQFHLHYLWLKIIKKLLKPNNYWTSLVSTCWN